MIKWLNSFLANCINNDLINDIDVPGLVKAEKNINVKNCVIFDVPNVRNFIIAHKEAASLERKKKDLFKIDIEACRDLIGASSSVSNFQRLSQSMTQFNLPKPKMLKKTIQLDRARMRSYIEPVIFQNQKRTNQSELGNCYGSVMKKETFPEFLTLYESKHKEIVKTCVALCVVGDEGRSSLKFNLVYSSSKYQLNSKYSIMLLIAEMKESSSAISDVLNQLPLKAIKDRADALKIPLYFSGNLI